MANWLMVVAALNAGFAVSNPIGTSASRAMSVAVGVFAFGAAIVHAIGARHG